MALLVGLMLGMALYLLPGAPAFVSVVSGAIAGVVVSLIVDQTFRSVPPDQIAGQNEKVSRRIRELEGDIESQPSEVEASSGRVRPRVRRSLSFGVLAVLVGCFFLPRLFGPVGLLVAVVITIGVVAVVARVGLWSSQPAGGSPRLNRRA